MRSFLNAITVFPKFYKNSYFEYKYYKMFTAMFETAICLK